MIYVGMNKRTLKKIIHTYTILYIYIYIYIYTYYIYNIYIIYI